MSLDATANVLAFPTGLVGGLAIAGFVVAILAALLTPVLSRLHRLEAWRGPLKLVPYGLLFAGAVLAGSAAALGSVTAPRPGVREVASGALAILCLTALLIGLFVAKPLISRMFAAQGGAAGGATALAGGSVVAGALPSPAGADQPAPAGYEASPAALPAPNSIDISRIDGQVRESSIKKVGEVVSAHPEEALAIIRTWLHQPV